MSEVIGSLRDRLELVASCQDEFGNPGAAFTCRQAADEIDRLTAELSECRQEREAFRAGCADMTRINFKLESRLRAASSCREPAMDVDGAVLACRLPVGHDGEHRA